MASAPRLGTGCSLNFTGLYRIGSLTQLYYTNNTPTYNRPTQHIENNLKISGKGGTAYVPNEIVTLTKISSWKANSINVPAPLPGYMGVE